MPVTKAFLTGWNKKLSKAANLPVYLQFSDARNSNLDMEMHYNTFGGFISFGKTISVFIKSAITGAHLYNFSIGTQPGLCGCMYFTGLSKSWSSFFKGDNKVPMTTTIIEFIKSLAMEMRYRSVTCSSVVPDYDTNVPNPTPEELKMTIPQWNDHKFKQNVLSCGFTVTQDFINERTKNRINIYHIKL